MTSEPTTTEKREETYNVKHGGLMRCCLLSLDDEMARRMAAGERMTVEGDTIQCIYHKPLDNPPTMICKKGYWQWNH